MTQNLPQICTASVKYTADAVQICGKVLDTQYIDKSYDKVNFIKGDFFRSDPDPVFN